MPPEVTVAVTYRDAFAAAAERRSKHAAHRVFMNRHSDLLVDDDDLAEFAAAEHLDPSRMVRTLLGEAHITDLDADDPLARVVGTFSPREVHEAIRRNRISDRATANGVLAMQRVVRRAPERRSTNKAKRHAAGTTHKATASTSSSSDEGPPLPDAANWAARGIRPHVEAPPSKLELAYEVYRRELAEGCRRTVDIYDAMRQAGVSITTAKRARKDIGVFKRRVEFGRGGWFEIEMPPARRWYFDKWIGAHHIEVWSAWGETENETYRRFCAAIRSYKLDAGLPTLEDVGRVVRAMAGAR